MDIIDNTLAIIAMFLFGIVLIIAAALSLMVAAGVLMFIGLLIEVMATPVYG